MPRSREVLGRNLIKIWFMSGFLDANRLDVGARPGLIREIRVLASTSSTNADAAAAAMAGQQPGLAIISAHQTKGRGRFTRIWEAPEDTALAISVLVEPRRQLSDWGWLSLVVGMAVVDGVLLLTEVPAQLKWPNDVMVGEHKLCGILSERVQVGDRDLAVLGLGINVRQTKAQLPVQNATSLALQGVEVDATSLALAVLASLEKWFRAWESGEPLTDAYLARSATVGREVALHVGTDHPIRGTAVGVDESGCLILQTPRGRRPFAAGDVVHLRPQQ